MMIIVVGVQLCGAAARAAPRVEASLQAGAGQVESAAASLVRPRLSFYGARSELSLSAPLWLRFANSNQKDSVWLNDWSDASTYVAFVERFTWAAQDDSWRLFAGALMQETLDAAVLVDFYTARLDPLRPRTGARLDWRTDNFEFNALVDDLGGPALSALAFKLKPLRLAGFDDTGRLTTSIEVASDFVAPTTTGTRSIVGIDTMLDFAWLRRQQVGVSTYVAPAANFSSAPGRGLGVHAGLRIELQQSKADTDAASNGLVLRLEWVQAGLGYTPGYFDAAYRAEREGVASYGWTPKFEVAKPTRTHIRYSADLKFKRVRAGIRGDGIVAGNTRLTLYGQVNLNDGQVTLMVLNRDVEQLGHVFRFNDSTYVLAEASYRVYKNLFGFAAFQRIWRFNDVADGRMAMDWMLGVGMGFGPAQTTNEPST